MDRLVELFETEGYTILDDILSETDIARIELKLEKVNVKKAGTRNLLLFDWCIQLAQSLKQHSSIAPLLTKDSTAVQCTYFTKSFDQNWLVALHRDFSIPVKDRIDVQGWSAWSKKEGINFVRPPEVVLRKLVAVRLHLEDNTEQNSPLQVVPGSHKNREPSGLRVNCPVHMGGALIMRPLLLHASSKLTTGTRRVLHFLYGPSSLPDNAEWANAV